MVFKLKLCYKDEAHLCSNPPVDFPRLLQLLKVTFKYRLPVNFKLHYVIQGQEQNIPLDSPEVYESLLKTEASATVRILVTEREENLDLDPLAVSEYEMISCSQRIESKESELLQEEKIRKIIKETIQEQIPSIVTQIKDVLLQELKPFLIEQLAISNQNNQKQAQREVILKKEDIEEEEEEEKGQENKPELNHHKEEIPKDENLEEKDKKGTGFLGAIKGIGNAISEISGKAAEAFDDWAQKLDDDPYVVVEEGKYPKSVVEKADHLKEVFSDETRKYFLEFAKKYDREVPLEELAQMYLIKKEFLDEPAVIIEVPADNQENAERLDDEQ